MKCEKQIARFLDCDNGERVPLSVRIHILHCRKCRDEIFAMKKGFDALKKESAYAIPFDISDIVMNRIEFLEIDYAHQVSNAKWLIAGAMIFSSIILLSYSEWASWLSDHSEGTFGIALHMIFGLTMTIYSALFIGTHIEYLKKLKDRFGAYAQLKHGRI